MNPVKKQCTADTFVHTESKVKLPLYGSLTPSDVPNDRLTNYRLPLRAPACMTVATSLYNLLEGAAETCRALSLPQRTSAQ